MKKSYGIFTGLFLFGVVLLIFLPSYSFAEDTSEGHTTQDSVRRACGKKLDTNEEAGVIGCTKSCGSTTTNVCDWSCGDPQGKGCRVIVFTSQGKRKTPRFHTSKIPLKE